MRAFRATVGLALALTAAVAVTACGGGKTNGTNGRKLKPVPSVSCLDHARTLAVTGRTVKLGAKAANFGAILVDRKTGMWLIPGGTEICGSQVSMKMSPVGKSATFQATLKPVSGKITLHGYGLALFTDAVAGGTVYKNGYTIMFEAPSRVAIYRRESGDFNTITDTYPNPVPMTDGGWHTLRVVVTHTTADRVDFSGYVDNVPAFTGHDSARLFTTGVWGPVNRSFYSTETVNPNSFSVTPGAAAGSAPSSTAPSSKPT
jgi:hypothetical protein